MELFLVFRGAKEKHEVPTVRNSAMPSVLQAVIPGLLIINIGDLDRCTPCCGGCVYSFTYLKYESEKNGVCLHCLTSLRAISILSFNPFASMWACLF